MPVVSVAPWYELAVLHAERSSWACLRLPGTLPALTAEAMKKPRLEPGAGVALLRRDAVSWDSGAQAGGQPERESAVLAAGYTGDAAAVAVLADQTRQTQDMATPCDLPNHLALAAAACGWRGGAEQAGAGLITALRSADTKRTLQAWFAGDRNVRLALIAAAACSPGGQATMKVRKLVPGIACQYKMHADVLGSPALALALAGKDLATGIMQVIGHAAVLLLAARSGQQPAGSSAAMLSPVLRKLSTTPLVMGTAVHIAQAIASAPAQADDVPGVRAVAAWIALQLGSGVRANAPHDLTHSSKDPVVREERGAVPADMPVVTFTMDGTTSDCLASLTLPGVEQVLTGAAPTGAHCLRPPMLPNPAVCSALLGGPCPSGAASILSAAARSGAADWSAAAAAGVPVSTSGSLIAEVRDATAAVRSLRQALVAALPAELASASWCSAPQWIPSLVPSPEAPLRGYDLLHQYRFDQVTIPTLLPRPAGSPLLDATAGVLSRAALVAAFHPSVVAVVPTSAEVTASAMLAGVAAMSSSWVVPTVSESADWHQPLAGLAELHEALLAEQAPHLVQLLSSLLPKSVTDSTGHSGSAVRTSPSTGIALGSLRLTSFSSSPDSLWRAVDALCRHALVAQAWLAWAAPVACSLMSGAGKRGASINTYGIAPQRLPLLLRAIAVVAWLQPSQAGLVLDTLMRIMVTAGRAEELAEAEEEDTADAREWDRGVSLEMSDVCATLAQLAVLVASSAAGVMPLCSLLCTSVLTTSMALRVLELLRYAVTRLEHVDETRALLFALHLQLDSRRAIMPELVARDSCMLLAKSAMPAVLLPLPDSWSNPAMGHSAGGAASPLESLRSFLRAVPLLAGDANV